MFLEAILYFYWKFRWKFQWKKIAYKRMKKSVGICQRLCGVQSNFPSDVSSDSFTFDSYLLENPSESVRIKYLTSAFLTSPFRLEFPSEIGFSIEILPSSRRKFRRRFNAFLSSRGNVKHRNKVC